MNSHPPSKGLLNIYGETLFTEHRRMKLPSQYAEEAGVYQRNFMV